VENVQAPVLTNVHTGFMTAEHGFPDGKKLFTVKEATAYLESAVGRDTLYAIARSGRVPVVKYGSKKLFPRSSLDLIASGTINLSGLVRRAR
jgi:excisionase family DNA binding protein